MEDLRYEFYIGAPVDTVWNTLMSREGTRQIFFGSELRSTFQVGDRYEYVGPGNDGDETVHVYGTVLHCEPNKIFSGTEHPGPSYYSNHAELETRITFTLETVGQCTKLTLVNDQWPANHPSYANASSHWWMILSNVKTLAETGRTLDLGW
ncbi:MAG: SRPBCC family protein [Paenibacillus dendritiformis]|uniref:SRPBCC family protein n=1 Tax=Paenibacillus dendritiformis TaxID=130049 RepID=UPI00143D261D|nr:SRPBCC family protein [Paenibacillus dendritiformis]MDU5143803.1 SRPBCC family protein [Paenibacillus dendritiformis]NKI22634.1 polyketide cyclase [Paenibacillus dendritiformis]NRF96620.1 SRPBCC family protein [Paenibacillus dendritiformis]